MSANSKARSTWGPGQVTKAIVQPAGVYPVSSICEVARDSRKRSDGMVSVQVGNKYLLQYHRAIRTRSLWSGAIQLE